MLKLNIKLLIDSTPPPPKKKKKKNDRGAFVAIGR